MLLSALCGVQLEACGPIHLYSSSLKDFFYTLDMVFSAIDLLSTTKEAIEATVKPL